ncbi:MAG: S1C family serine protease [Rhodospirillales bacterium]|jgi:S1-C subfamily serine protease
MKRPAEWAFPADLQPDPARQAFDLDAAVESVVGVRTEIPADAFTASVLGTERAGSGVVIRGDGLILTIGYLVTEASAVWLSTNDGRVLPAHVLGYDQATGFGLVQALGRLNLPPLPIGSVTGVQAGDRVVVIGHGGRAHTLQAEISDKREFAGYWEYLLDEALFTTPAHPQWGGTAIVDATGRLLAIGSLLVEERVGRRRVQGNMGVPVDLLVPILDDLVERGRSRAVPRPWLGVYVGEAASGLVVGGVAKGGPADSAGLREGDQLVDVAGVPVATLAEFFRRVWGLGPAGTEVQMTIRRRDAEMLAVLRSGDRDDFLKKPSLH